MKRSQDRQSLLEASRMPGDGRNDSRILRTRREFLVQSTSTAIAVGFLGPAGLACNRGKTSDDLQVLNQEQAATFNAWCDVLAVGASEAGVARYLDQYLAAPFAETFLFLKLLENAPLDEFYLKGIAGIDDESEARFDKRFTTLTDEQRRSVVDAAAKPSTVAWTDPDPSFFYFVSRADAVDVVYGTERGFLDLGVPYLPHIRPPEPW